MSLTAADLKNTSTKQIEFELNGKTVTAQVTEDSTLLDVLRDQFGIISPKNGCQPLGQCGCCTVLVNGRAMVSCVQKATRAEGKSVTTLEGFEDEDRKLLADSFVVSGGLQCGFCIPGIAVRAKALIEKSPEPTRDDIKRALLPHLCRCTGYKKIEDAIDTYAKAKRGEALPEFDWSGKVGGSLPKYQGSELVLGEKQYVDDIRLTGMIYGALRFADHPRAIVKKIDASAVLDIPGVHGVYTAKDVPGERYQGLIYKDWPLFVAEGEKTHCEGDVIAAVAADTQELARKAAALIDIEYEVLEAVDDPREAIKPGAPIVHEDTHPESNLLSTAKINRGDDVEQALANSAHVIHESFETQRIEHLFLEPEACIAIPGKWFGENPPPAENGCCSKLRYGAFEGPEGGSDLHVLSQSQGVFDDRRQIASLLGLTLDNVTVELVSNGGGFGGKEDLSIQGQTALLSWLTGKPVKITLTRMESVRLHPKRHPIWMEYWVGCDAEGNLTAVKSRMIGDTGAFASVGTKVLERAGGHACGPYKVPNVDVEAHCVYTNNVPCGAMRGFGVNQAAWGIEQIMDLLADKVGIDKWEIRWRNALDVGDTFCTGQVLTKSVGLKKTLLAVKDQFKAAKYAGIACGIKNVGIGNGMPDGGEAVIRVQKFDDGKPGIVINSGFTEMGQGLLTILIQSLCEIVPVDPRRVQVRIDTTKPTPCGMTTASRATVLGGNAVIEAAKQFAAALGDDANPNGTGYVAESALEKLVGQSWLGKWEQNDTVPLGSLRGKDGGPIKTHLSYGFATQVAILDDEGKLQKVIAAHDVGKVMNKLTVEGQIEGSVHMGLGYALTEDCPSEGARLQVKDLRTFGVLRANEMPEVEVLCIEEHEPDGPFGAKGVGEIGLVPTAPAVAGARRAFDGVFRTKLPMDR